MQAISLGRSNCTGLRSLAASASCCSGLDDVNGKIGIMGGIYLLLRPLLPLLVDEASSSFYKRKTAQLYSRKLLKMTFEVLLLLPKIL